MAFTLAVQHAKPMVAMRAPRRPVTHCTQMCCMRTAHSWPGSACLSTWHGMFMTRSCRSSSIPVPCLQSGTASHRCAMPDAWLCTDSLLAHGQAKCKCKALDMPVRAGLVSDSHRCHPRDPTPGALLLRPLSQPPVPGSGAHTAQILPCAQLVQASRGQGACVPRVWGLLFLTLVSTT